MTPTELLMAIDGLGIRLAADGDRLVIDAPRGVLTAERVGALQEHKAAILAVLPRRTVETPDDYA
jgi:hypothetical protein